MNVDRFEGILGAQFKRIQDVLVVKAAEYATEDRLAHFKKAAHLRGCSVPQAVGGLLAKHTVSVFDMIESGKEYPMAMWDEKITDHLNYLILLRAVLEEGNEENEAIRSSVPDGHDGSGHSDLSAGQDSQAQLHRT